MQGSTGTYQSPLDNETYDLIQTLTSKLEAIELYEQYQEDSSGDAADVFREMAEQDRQNAERIVGLLKNRFDSLELPGS
ncbi:MAG: hypothetical protein ACJ77N_13240 [Chloroflexota bacterium]|jgi:hypothetical protein